MVGIENLTAHVDAVTQAPDIPAFIDRQQPVPRYMHHGQFGHDAEEHLVAMKDVDVVHEARIMLQALPAIPLELTVQVSHTLGQFPCLICRTAGNEGIRHITGLPISELLHIIHDVETADCQIVETGEEQLPEQLGKFQTKDDARIETVHDFIQKTQKFPILDFTAVLLLEKSVLDILKIMVDVQWYAVEGFTLGM